MGAGSAGDDRVRVPCPPLFREVIYMEFEQILTLIGSYCFPIVACIVMFWKSAKDTEAHRQEMDKMSEALNNNTLALTRLEDRLEAMQQNVSRV